MQIAHRKVQTNRKMLSDRTDALAARVDAVQANPSTLPLATHNSTSVHPNTCPTSPPSCLLTPGRRLGRLCISTPLCPPFAADFSPVPSELD
jgi:hypothetical protein